MRPPRPPAPSGRGIGRTGAAGAAASTGAVAAVANVKLALRGRKVLRARARRSDRQAADAEASASFARLLQRLHLGERDVEVMALHFHDGRSFQEIATLFGIDKSSVRDRLGRCLRILDEARLPRPVKPSGIVRVRRGRRIHMDGSLMEALLHGHLGRLIVDQHGNQDAHEQDPDQPD